MKIPESFPHTTLLTTFGTFCVGDIMSGPDDNYPHQAIIVGFSDPDDQGQVYIRFCLAGLVVGPDRGIQAREVEYKTVKVSRVQKGLRDGLILWMRAKDGTFIRATFVGLVFDYMDRNGKSHWGIPEAPLDLTDVVEDPMYTAKAHS